MAYIEFSVEHQIIHRTDCFRVVKRSQNYLHAKFNFVGSEWSGLVKTAEFRNGKNGTPYSVLLENDECLVPHEVLSGNDKYVYVSVFAGNLITVNVCSVFLETSGYWENAVPAVDPTPSVYAQIINRLENVETSVADSARSASTSATHAHNSEVNASVSESNALRSEQNAATSEQNAQQYANSAQASATSAQSSASSAGNSAQSASSSASSALSSAQRAESASSSIQNMNVTAHSVEGDPTASWSNGTLSLGLPKGADGYTPQKGIDYNDGAKGNPGNDGYSPIASVSKSGNTATITITDKNGTTTASVSDGSKGNPGQDGVSPSVVVNNITGGHQVIITDKIGNHSFNVLDGDTGNSGVYVGETTPSDPDVNVWIDTDGTEDGIDAEDVSYDDSETYSSGSIGNEINAIKNVISSKLDSPSTAGTNGQVLTSDGSGGQTWEDPTETVTDVQINGTSIIDNGVAEIPLATSSNAGVIKVDPSFGLSMRTSPNQDTLMVRFANQSSIKGGSNDGMALNPARQHESAFYGLAKAAGDSTQSASSNAVGAYTDAAKVAIQKMLGIYEAPWELIREDTVTNATEADIEITVDGNGNAFELTDAIVLFETPKQSTPSAFGGSGVIRFFCGNDVALSTYIGAYTQEANASARGGYAYLENKGGGLIITKYKSQTSTSNHASLGQRYYEGFVGEGTPVQIIDNFYVDKIIIAKVTGTGHYKLYGKRKWN